MERTALENRVGFEILTISGENAIWNGEAGLEGFIPWDDVSASLLLFLKPYLVPLKKGNSRDFDNQKNPP